MMIDKGISPAEARNWPAPGYSAGVNGAYGTGIMGLVEKGMPGRTIPRLPNNT